MTPKLPDAFSTDSGEVLSLAHLEYLAEHVPGYSDVAKQAAMELGKDPRHGASLAAAMAELHKQDSPLVPPGRQPLKVVNRIAKQKKLL
jgi:hypothetical protein